MHLVKHNIALNSRLSEDYKYASCSPNFKAKLVISWSLSFDVLLILLCTAYLLFYELLSRLFKFIDTFAFLLRDCAAICDRYDILILKDLILDLVNFQDSEPASISFYLDYSLGKDCHRS